jgi:hypothetical protein
LEKGFNKSTVFWDSMNYWKALVVMALNLKFWSFVRFEDLALEGEVPRAALLN